MTQRLLAPHEIRLTRGKHPATELAEHYDRLYAAYKSLRSQLGGRIALERLDQLQQLADASAADDSPERPELLRAALCEAIAEITALRAELAGAEERGRRLADACRGLLSEMHVGEGKVVCPDAFMPHVRAMYELLRADLRRRAGTATADGGESQP